MHKPLAVCLSLVLAQSGNAQEAGSLSGTLDGQDTVLNIIASQSDHRGDVNYASVSLVFSVESDNNDLKHLFLGFELHGGEAATPDIRLVSAGNSMFFPREDENFVLEITTAEKSGDFLSVSGRVIFNADHSTDFGRTLNPENSYSLDGEFEVVVGPV